MTVDTRRRTLLHPAATSLVRGLAVGAMLLAAACSSSNHSVGTTPVTPTTYTIGGSVSGLTAGGLVLANGTDTVTVASGATSFTLPTAVASDAAYTVTVQTAPAGLMCSVAMGTGTVQTANVSNVVVTCSNASYTVGGSVTGLNGTGLVLQNGTDTVTVASGATSYVFPTSVANTSSYMVSVKTQPAGLSCSVVNGTGTMGAANVTNVNVTCSDQPFTLGGTVSGLVGAGGLVLANGTDTVTVAANATTFTLPTGVDFSAAYAVTVQTQPAGLTCTVSNGSGTMPAANVTSVGVTCSALSFHLGGTVTGLTSAGLVLANGSDTVTVAANASNFTLPTAVAYTAPYAVTVHTQPTGLTCTATSATGNMPANDVTSVVVTCAANSYTLGGTISNLHGTGLVLMNGTEQLTVASNAGTFTFVNGVAYGATYTVTIHTQPRGYTCTFGTGTDTGTMPASNVTSVVVNCTQNKVWAYVADNTDNAILVYSVNNSTHNLSATPVNSYPYGNGTNPQPLAVTVNAAGTVLYSVDGNSNSISWFTIDDSDGSLNYVNTIATGGYTPNQLVINAAGTFAFVPNQYGNSIAVFTVDPTTGDLGVVAGSPFAVPSTSGTPYPTSVTLHPTLPILYVTASFDSTIVPMSISSTGVLAAGTPVMAAGVTPTDLVIDSAGAYAYATDRDDTRVEQFSITNGVLASLGLNAQPGANPVSIAFDPTGTFLYTANTGDAANGVTAISVDSGTHIMSTGASLPTGTASNTVLVDSTGAVYVTNTGDNSVVPALPASISAFTADQTGALTPNATNATSTGPAGAVLYGLAFAKP